MPVILFEAIDKVVLADAFQDLRELKVEVAYPLLLELYDDYSRGALTKADFVSAVRLIEAFVFRRAACGIPTNALNKIFATFGRGIRKENYLESMQARLLLLLSNSRFPDDDEFKRELGTRDLYKLPRRSYFFRRLENYGKKEYVEINEYSIEHIMPQNERLSPKWKDDLGPEWQRIHHTWLHTLGNLTLTGYTRSTATVHSPRSGT